ncbi:MAG: hypothetical protein HY719_05390 [Planctomycetes bacterium]|nr:hypothetical protein [Planctomycetota bacterium]
MSAAAHVFDLEPAAVERLHAFLPEGVAFGPLLDAAGDAAEPREALRLLADLCAATPLPAADPRLPERIGRLAAFFGGSPLLGTWLLASPASRSAAATGAYDGPLSPEALRRRCAEVLADAGGASGCDEAALFTALRRFKREAFAAIALRDLGFRAPLAEVSLALTTVAECAAAAAVEVGARALAERYGAPQQPVGKVMARRKTSESRFVEERENARIRGNTAFSRDDDEMVRSRFSPDRILSTGCNGGPPAFAVLGYGKLGGRELNYSSDVDLAFIFGGDPHAETRGGRESIAAADWHARLAAFVVRALSQVTDAGYVFRVDTRLRPFGTQGPLASSLDRAVEALADPSATWERQAALKCRPVAGDEALGERYLSRVTPLVYKRFLTWQEIADIRALRERMEQKAASDAAGRFHLKAGAGGIRDVEFLVQFHQLLSGGRLESIRAGNTLDGLALLNLAGIVTADEAGELSAAYRFLRAAEHRVMLEGLFQEHRLPDTPDALRRVAVRMGFLPSKRPDPAAAFHAELQRHATAAREAFNRHFARLFAGGTEPAAAETALILDPDMPDADRRAVLAGRGFRDPAAAAANLARMAREEGLFSAYSPRAQKFLAGLAPALLVRLAASPDPDLGLANLEGVAARLCGKATFYQLLAENHQALEVFVDLCAHSQPLADLLLAAPGRIDEFIDRIAVVGPAARPPAGLPGATEPGALHEFKHLETLRIAIRDIQNKSPVEETLADLTALADAVLQVETARALVAHGQGPVSAPFAVVGLGKLGGGEMGFGSDLDLLFLHDPAPAATAPFSRVAAEIMSSLSRVTEHGALYETDARLRPLGSQGLLATSIPELLRYHESGTACLWERLMMTRARVVFPMARPATENAPAADFLARARRALDAVAYQRPLPQGWRADLRAMRARMEAASAGNRIKRGPGGLTDVEFITQALQIEHGPGDQRLRVTSTASALDLLTRRGYLPPAEAASLLAAWRFLRRLENRIRLMSSTADKAIPEAREARDGLARRLGYSRVDNVSPGDALLADFHRVTGEVRATFDRHFPAG